MPRSSVRIRRRVRAVILLGGLVAGSALGVVRAVGEPAELRITGPEDGTVVGGAEADELAFGVAVSDPSLLDEVRLLLDGSDVTADAERAGDAMVLRPTGLADGEHRLDVQATRPFPRAVLDAGRAFTLDTTPPEITVLEPTGPVQPGQPVTLRARVGSSGVTVDGLPVAVADGEISHTWPTAPGAPVTLAASDAHGNRTSTVVPIEVTLPGDDGAEPIRAVHMSPTAWAVDELREPILALLDEGRINTIELDLKNEAGQIGYASRVPMAQQIGSSAPAYDLEDVVTHLHARGARVVGRLVAFRDPVLADWAREQGRLELLVQDASGAPYGAYGASFTNPAHPEVAEYNLAVAEEAAALGVDDVLWDYIRRPEGLASSLRYPGLDGTDLAPTLVGFLAAAEQRLEPYGTRQGASVFGIAATQPDSVAQPIPEMAQHLAYVSPMVYPSHWARGEYGVAHPDAQPYEIVAASLPPFQEAVEGTGAEVIPWLQDFTLGVRYGPDQVRAQIDAGASLGIDGFFLWDPAATYTGAALDPS